MTKHQLNKICTADYSEANVEWGKWAVEDSDTAREDSDIN